MEIDDPEQASARGQRTMYFGGGGLVGILLGLILGRVMLMLALGLAAGILLSSMMEKRE
jgi:hypothetical protein